MQPSPEVAIFRSPTTKALVVPGCNATALDGAVVIDEKGIVREIGCVFETKPVRTTAEGARTRAALFASKNDVALKINQDGEMAIYRDGKSKAIILPPVS